MKIFKRRIDDRGFSLIELIVTVLITSVLMIGVIAFLSTSRSAYQNVAVSSTLQEETLTVKRILSEYMSEAKSYGFQKNVDIDGSSGNTSVLWLVARDTESNTGDKSYFFVLDIADKKLRYCTGASTLCPKDQIVLTDDAKTQIANECFKDEAKMKYSVIGEHVESMDKGGVAERYDGTDLVAIKMVYRYPDETGPKYNDEITVVTRNRLRATPTPTPKPAGAGGSGGSGGSGGAGAGGAGAGGAGESGGSGGSGGAGSGGSGGAGGSGEGGESPETAIPTNAPDCTTLLVSNDNNGWHSKMQFPKKIKSAVVKTDSTTLDLGANGGKYNATPQADGSFLITTSGDWVKGNELSTLVFNVNNGTMYFRIISFEAAS